MADRPSRAEQRKPERIQGTRHHSFALHVPVAVVASQTRRCQPMRRILERAKVLRASQKSVVLLGFLALPDTFFAIRMIGIIVVLMNGSHHG